MSRFLTVSTLLSHSLSLSLPLVYLVTERVRERTEERREREEMKKSNELSCHYFFVTGNTRSLSSFLSSFFLSVSFLSLRLSFFSHNMLLAIDIQLQRERERGRESERKREKILLSFSSFSP